MSPTGSVRCSTISIGQVDQNIVVETSIDPKLQSIAEAAVIDELAAKSVKFNVSQGALVAMSTRRRGARHDRRT